jgi:transcriptional regulator with XRE-family HTH domain
MDDEVTLGRKLRSLREATGQSLRELAREIGVSAPFLSDVELGRRYPSGEVLAILSEKLGVKTEDLKNLDTRTSISDLRRMLEKTPSLGFAFRSVVNHVNSGKLSPDALAAKLRELSRGTKSVP